jgi:hypothetical protein
MRVEIPDRGHGAHLVSGTDLRNFTVTWRS